MKHSVPHHLPADQARRMLEEMLETYGAHPEVDLSTRWTDEDRADVDLRVKGQEVRGSIRITPECFDLDFDMPWVFRPLKRVITRNVDREVQRWLANF